MTDTAVVEAKRPQGIIASMAAFQGMDPRAYEATLRATIFPSAGTTEQLAAFLLVARKYNLDPITREIHAFPSKAGGIVPVVSIDGWLNLANQHKAFNGMTFEDHKDDAGKVTAITCKIYRRDRDHPIEVTEYLLECTRNTEPWKQWPVRMLRHKSTIQAIRYAFGFAGMFDQDEAERIIEGVATVEPAPAIKQINARVAEKQKPREETPPPTFANVADYIAKSTTTDEVDLAFSLAEHVVDPAHRVELLGDTRRKGLPQT